MPIVLSMIAGFAGCRLDPSSFFSQSIQSDTLPRAPRTLAFLLCALLFLREQAGIAQADLPYRITLSEERESIPHTDEESTLLSALPGFEEYAICFEDGKVILELPVRRSLNLLFSSPKTVRLRLCIEPISQ